jgi:hypothetical protein
MKNSNRGKIVLGQKQNPPSKKRRQSEGTNRSPTAVNFSETARSNLLLVMPISSNKNEDTNYVPDAKSAPK